MENRFMLRKWPTQNTFKKYTPSNFQLRMKHICQPHLAQTFHISLIYWVSGQNWFYEFERALWDEN